MIKRHFWAIECGALIKINSPEDAEKARSFNLPKGQLKKVSCCKILKGPVSAREAMMGISASIPPILAFISTFLAIVSLKNPRKGRSACGSS